MQGIWHPLPCHFGTAKTLIYESFLAYGNFTIGFFAMGSNDSRYVGECIGYEPAAVIEQPCHPFLRHRPLL